MKAMWVLCWEAIPGKGEQREQFTSLKAAKLAMRKLISRYVELKEPLEKLDPEAAKYITRYLSDPQFPADVQDIPVDHPDPEEGELLLSSGSLICEYPYGAFPQVRTNLVLESVEDDAYKFDFWVEHPREIPKGDTLAFSARIEQHVDYGTSAYPLMILRVLDEHPKTQDAIIMEVFRMYGVKMERKAVGRHLKLLDALGFRISKSKEGYFV